MRWCSRNAWNGIRKAFTPLCVAGERRAPPEDCGGIPGFCNLLDALGDPEHPDHEEMVEWSGKDYAPEAFSAGEVNPQLARIRVPRKKRSTSRK